MSISIYTDGAYSASRSKGGYAFIIYENDKPVKKYLKSIENSTNQRTEMLAVISVFRYLLKLNTIPNVTIFTDSMYVVGTCDRNWKINANQDLWDILLPLYEQLKNNVTFTHIRGHVGIEGNELCDLYAVLASEAIIC